MAEEVAGTTHYSGSAFSHEYSVTARHSPWKTVVERVSIDGVEYQLGKRTAEDNEAPDLQIRAFGWMTKRLKVRRRTADGSLAAREEIHVKSAVFGGASEVDVRKDLDVVPLLPEAESRSEARDLRRVACPEQYGLVSGLTTLVRLLGPLLGLGALIAWLFEPISRWLNSHIWPWLEPTARWLQDTLTPVGQFFEWLFTVLFGGIQDMPEWVSATIRIAAPVGVAYLASRKNLKRRNKKLEEQERERSRSESARL